MFFCAKDLFLHEALLLLLPSLQFFTGVMITKEYVATAAEVFALGDDPRFWEAHPGAIEFSKDNWNHRWQGIAEIHVNPYYNKGRWLGDSAYNIGSVHKDSYDFFFLGVLSVTDYSCLLLIYTYTINTITNSNLYLHGQLFSTDEA